MDMITLTKDDVMQLLPDRPVDMYKGQAGSVLLLCGSVGFSGAAYLAAMGALRCGAGLVYLGVPRSIYEIVAGKLNEAIVFPLPDFRGKLSFFAARKIRNYLNRVDCVVIGPGIGRSYGTKYAVQYVLKHFKGPVILDADGINQVAKHKDIVRGRKGNTVLTPHEGEFRRLSDFSGTRFNRVVSLAKEIDAVVLLKGHKTLISDGAKTYCNPTGNPGMATGGCGDVLAGMIGALCAQSIPPLQAAACGAWLHGMAGDISAQELSQMGMLPTDMLNVLPRLLK